jgi:hypothetical protein
VPAGVRLGPVGGGHLVVELQPAVEARLAGGVGHGGVVGVPHGHDAPGLEDPAHLAQRGHRIDQVLEDLVGVDHVEVAVGIGEGVDVGHLEADVVEAALLR